MAARVTGFPGTHAGTRAIEPWPVTNLDAAGSASIVGGGGHPSPFGSTVRLRRDEAARILDALSQMATVAGPAPGDGAFPGIGHLLRLAQATLCLGETGAGDVQVAMGASVVLDLAAELLSVPNSLGRRNASSRPSRSRGSRAASSRRCSARDPSTTAFPQARGGNLRR